MSKKLNAFFVIALILFSMFPVQAAPPVSYNKELASDVALRGALFTDGDATGFYASYVGDSIQISSTNHYTDKTIKIKGTALTSRLKMYNGLKVGYTHVADDGTVTHEIKPLVIDNQGFAYLTADFSTVIISGMTGYTTTTYSSQSGNQSFSVPDGSSYDLNITNNMEGGYTVNGKDYLNQSLVTINGSMVTTESGIPLGLNINLAGVRSDGADIALTYTNGTEIARESESVNTTTDDVMLWYPFDTVSSTDLQFYVYWGNAALTEPAANSTYGSQAVWDSDYVNVWHMQYDPSGSAPQLIDSTGNNDATSEGSMASGDLVDTSFGKGIDFDGTDDGFSYSNVLDVNTVSIMSRFANDGRAGGFRGLTGSMAWANGDLHYHILTDNKFSMSIKSGTVGYSASGTTLFDAANYGTYRNVHGVYDGGAGTIRAYIDGVNEGTASSVPSQLININPVKIGQAFDATRDFQGIIGELWISKIVRSSDYILTNHKNLNNPTATGTTPFYLSIGAAQQVSGTANITASITGGSDIQSYNTSQSRAFTLTPTGETNNVVINTTSTDYNVVLTTYWTDDTTLQTETSTAGYAKQYINYTPAVPITSADLNTTFTFDFSAQDYIGTATSVLNEVSKTTTRAGQDINASVGSLTADTPYWWNVTVPYNNVFTLSNQSDQTASVGVSKAFTDSDYSDPEGLAIDTRLWNFGDGDTSAASNPSHTYTTAGTFKANYTVTETATVSPQTLTREFNVTVTLRPPQNLATTTTTESINVSWDSYASADKYSVYIQSDTMIYTATPVTIDGIKDTAWDNAYHLIVPTPNPRVHTDYDTIDIMHDDDYVYIMAEMKDADTNANDDYAEAYFDLTNNGLTTDDRAWKMKENGDIQRLKWSGSAWISAGVAQADSAATGSGTNNIIVEMRIPIALFDGNIYEGALIPMLIERECTSLNPDVESYHPIGNINNSDVSLWEDVYITNQTEHTTFVANTTNTYYNITGLDYFEWYKVGVTAWNGTIESTHSHTPAITDNLPSWSVSGYVKDQSGVGISVATVWFHGLFVSDRTQTDIDGYYIRHMGDYNYTMYANKTAYQENSISVNVFGANLTNQNVTLQAFEITDWEIYQLLLDIQDEIGTGGTEQDLQSSAIPIDIFIVLIIVSFILMLYAFLYTDYNNYTHIISALLSMLLNFIIALNAYNGITKLMSVGSYINEVVYQSVAISTVFTILGIIMMLIAVAKIYDVVTLAGSEIKW